MDELGLGIVFLIRMLKAGRSVTIIHPNDLKPEVREEEPAV